MSEYVRHPAKYTLYEKRGRRYYPVQEYDPKVTDAFPAGFSLVHVRPGVMSIRYGVQPDVACLTAAAKLMEDAMVKAMMEAQKWQPREKAITEKQREAYKKFCEVMGTEIYPLQSASISDVVDAGIKALVEYAKKEHNCGHSCTTGSEGH